MNRPKILHIGGTIYWVLRTRNPDTMVLKDADSDPTVAIRKNGASTADSVTVTKRAATTGIYDCSYNPAGEVEGDEYTVEETATVTGTTTGSATYSSNWEFAVVALERGTNSAALASGVNVTQFGGTSITSAAGIPEVKVASIATDAVNALALNSDAAVEIAAAVWDRVLSAANHNIASSAGRRLRQLGSTSITGGTAQAGTSNSITLASGESSTNEIYDSNLLIIVGGTGAGQSRVIVEYNGTSKVATVDQVWVVTPDSSSEYEMIADHQSDISHHGLAQAGAASTITLASTASAVNDVYLGSTIYLSTSTGTGQSRLITAYNGTTKVATVSPDWVTTPASSSVYKILPFGRTIVDSIASAAITAIQSGLATQASVESIASVSNEAY